MNKIIKTAMKANRFYNKAKNFKGLWESVDGLINWNFHKRMSKELNISWFEIDEVEVISSFNSYNCSSSITYLLHECEYNGVKFLALAFHLGGDVRGNYGDLIFINQSKDEFLSDLMDLTLDFDSYGFSWYEYPFWGESGIVYGAYAHKRSESYNEKLGYLSGYYYDKYPKGFITVYEKVSC